MRKGMQRLKSWAFWAGLVAIIVAVSGAEPATINTWAVLIDTVAEIFSNPYLFFSMIVAVVGLYNNTADKEHF